MTKLAFLDKDGTSKIPVVPQDASEKQRKCLAQAQAAGWDEMQHRILLVEDDSAIAQFIVDALGAEGLVTDHAVEGVSGLTMARDGKYDLIILDRMLPGLDGLTILNTLRSVRVVTPVLFLSALGEVDDRVDGLSAGANDYLTKPFAIAELVARVQTQLRQIQQQRPDLTKHSFEGLELDRVARTVSRDGQAIDLQPREFRLLEYLMRHLDQTVTRKMLLEGVWDYSFDPGTNVIDVHVSRLRKKLEFGVGEALLHTVRGAGFRFGKGD
jgi:two-component system, OmpR family, response regulator